MKVTFNKTLRTPAGIVKRTLPIILVGVFLIACNRDLLYVDDLLAPSSGNDLLVYKYEAEVSTYKTFYNLNNEGNLTRSIPDVERTKFELRISKSGAVEIFTEYLDPSENFHNKPSVNLPGELKYEHFKDGVVKLFDSERTLIAEYSAQKALVKYGEIYQYLMNIENANVTNLIDLTVNEFKLNALASSRSYPSLENAYDDHPDYKVYRSSTYDEMLNEDIINEIIIHQPSSKVYFISGYTAGGEVLSRTEFGYEGDKLIALVETRVDNSDPANTYTEIVSTQYDDFQFNLNLD